MSEKSSKIKKTEKEARIASGKNKDSVEYWKHYFPLLRKNHNIK